MVVSIHHDDTIQYPDSGEHFSPDERFPEYDFEAIANSPNGVYRAVRNCLAGAGKDDAHYGQKTWNPLGEYIHPGDRVFVLCNFVKHNDLNRRKADFHAKCTHGSVLRAVIDYVLLALKGQGEVTFGNAPLQSCDWGRVIHETGANPVREFYLQQKRPLPKVELRDLRQHVVQQNRFGLNRVKLHTDGHDCVEVNLRDHSLLEALYTRPGGAEPHFRVTDYPPQRTERCHGRGRHVYLVSRAILHSRVIISVPKLKTHEKVAMTCALKGCVGAVAHKDCLAHHRYGPPSKAGDEYPEGLAFLRPLSALHDYANRGSPGLGTGLAHWVDYLSRKVARRFTRALEGAWPGNDTCWRMALDVARVLDYADENGILRNSRERRHLVFTDGIIAGEGEGPLNPRAVKLGYVNFSDNPVAADYVNCLAMGFDPAKVPLVREAFGLAQYPLIDANAAGWDTYLNGRIVTMAALAGVFQRIFKPPREWRPVLESHDGQT